MPIQGLEDFEYKEKIELIDLPGIRREITVEKVDLTKLIDMCDGLILPGGYRIYNFYKYIINYALENNMPIFGTCLGMQILALMDNNSNCLLEDTTGFHKQKNVEYVHDVNVEDNTILKEILNCNRIKVNSVHKFYVKEVNNFKVSAYSEDGLIEAIELPGKRFVVGVQWHPEKMISYDENANKILDFFLEECENYRKDANNNVKLAI
jgi:gamma-glutamyl-gamma-aminobutyrate hydrolase PuuD